MLFICSIYTLGFTWNRIKIRNTIKYCNYILYLVYMFFVCEINLTNYDNYIYIYIYIYIYYGRPIALYAQFAIRKPKMYHES